MSQDIVNPYEPPKSDVETITPEGSAPDFFSVTTLKLVVMSILTFGLYELYWFYRNWARIRDHTSANIMPFWRAFFAIFWVYSLFKQFNDGATTRGMPESIAAGGLTLLYILLSLASNAPAAYSLVGLFGVVAIVPANSLAARVNLAADPAFENNGRFTVWHWLVMALGAALIGFGIWGTLVGEQ